jgi:hypothetical protein
MLLHAFELKTTQKRDKFLMRIFQTVRLYNVGHKSSSSRCGMGTDFGCFFMRFQTAGSATDFLCCVGNREGTCLANLPSKDIILIIYDKIYYLKEY